MFLNQFIEDFSALGKFLLEWESGIVKENRMDEALLAAGRTNPFFTPYMQRHAIKVIAETFLERGKLRKWVESYPNLHSAGNGSSTVGIIMAGNIPLVGFHDFLCAMACGCFAVVKLSSKDNVLLPVIFNELCRINDFWRGRAMFFNTSACVAEIFAKNGCGYQTLGASDCWYDATGKEDWKKALKKACCLISTGSNSTAASVMQEFAGITQLVRKQRFSFAVVKKGMQLDGLCEDVFLYYGLGCRNVNYFFVPEDYDIEELSGYLKKAYELVFGNGQWCDTAAGEAYMNAFRRNRAILKMEGVEFTDGGFFILREMPYESVPMGVLGYARYASDADIAAFEEQKIGMIQKKYCTFGNAQAPSVSEYADGADTIEFILNNTKN